MRRPDGRGRGADAVVRRQMAADHVLVCAGRASPTADLNLAAAGLVVAEKGRLPVNEHYRTNVPHIYAVGRRDRVPGPGLDQRRAGAGGRLPRLRAARS